MDLTKSRQEVRGSYHSNLMVFNLSTSDYSIELKLCPIDHDINQELSNFLTG